MPIILDAVFWFNSFTVVDESEVFQIIVASILKLLKTKKLLVI